MPSEISLNTNKGNKLRRLASVINLKLLHTGCAIAHSKSCYDHKTFDANDHNHSIKSSCSIVSVATTIRRNKL